MNAARMHLSTCRVLTFSKSADYVRDSSVQGTEDLISANPGGRILPAAG